MRRLPALGLILLGLLVTSLGVGYALFEQALDYPGTVPLPREIAGLPLAMRRTGRQALGELARLHGKSFLLASGAVGMYGDQHQVKLWVAGAPIRPLASRMLAAMEDKIAEGNSPFTPTGEHPDGDRVIYELAGMGQKHFYFQSGDMLIWLAADAGLAEEALAQTLEFYP
ncbi:MAG TPA: hypothetical protein VE136_03305 [Anaerolineales bacterium]|nr:hypothetical protein [Anaerolineales bacterium]